MKFVVFLGAKHHFRYLEYISLHFNVNPEDFIIFLFSSKHNELENQIDFKTFKHVFYLNEISLKSSIFNRGNLNLIIRTWGECFGKKDHIILFSTVSYDFVVLFKSIFRNTKIYLLDDGFGFFSNVDFFFKRNIWWLRLRYILFSILFFRPIWNFKVNFFSEFTHKLIPLENIICYSRVKVSIPVKPIEKGTLIILGIPNVEIGMISYESYLEYLKKIMEHFKENIFTYYPHRVESEKKLKDVQNLGIKLIQSKGPFESFLIDQAIFPEFILGFMSSHAAFELLTKFENQSKIIILDNLSSDASVPIIIKNGIVEAYKKLEVPTLTF